MATTHSSGGDFQSTPGTPLIDEDGIDKLEVLTYNFLSVGQWEAARGFLQCLARQGQGQETAKHILKSMILNSKGLWNESASLPSENHLVLLALQSYLELFPEDIEGIPSAVQQQHEFNLLLHSSHFCEGYTPQISDWLRGYYTTHCLGSTPHSLIPLHTFHTTIQSFLRSVLYSNLSLGHVLISYLTVRERPHYTSNNELLQCLYIDCVDHYWGKLEKASRKVDTNYNSKIVDLADKIHGMLSLIDPQPDMSRFLKRLDNVLIKLLQSDSQSCEGKLLFTFHSLYSCFLGRSNTILIQRFESIEEIMKDVSDDINSPSTGEDYWRQELFRALKNKQHFLERIMDIGLKAISSGQLEDLAKLVQDPMLMPIKPLLLLLGWDRYLDISSGQKLLDILWPRHQTAEPLLYAGCCKLAFQVGLVQWCLEKAKPFLPASSTPPASSAGEMFQGLKNHSILYVLHHSTPLSLLDPLEVIDILKLRPDSSSSSLSLTPSVSYSPSESLTSPAKLTSSSLQPEQERDINTFRGFYTLKLIMEGIWHAILLSNGIQLADKKVRIEVEKPSLNMGEVSVKSPVVRKLDLSDSEYSFEKVETNALPSLDLYTTEVIKRFDEARGHLSCIFPLNFRLEVLENVFSLLFLSSDDIQLSKNSNGKGDEIVDGVNSSHSHSSAAENEPLSSINSIAFIRKQRGFLVDEKTARDILLLLNDSLFELTAAKFSLLNTPTKGMGQQSLSIDSIMSAINPSLLQQRIALLQKQVNEAKWRLELVSSKTGITSNSKLGGGMTSDDSMSDISEHEEETDKKEKEIKPFRKVRSHDIISSRDNKGPSPIPRQQPPVLGEISRPRSESFHRPIERPVVRTPSTDEVYESSGHCADIEEKSPLTLLKRRKIRSRVGSESKTRKTKLQIVHKEACIVNQMLASPVSLLCKCLRHQNYLKAFEVIKMFGMENQLGDSLVQFSEQFEKVSLELVTQSRTSTLHPSPSLVAPDQSTVGGVSTSSGLQVAIMNATDTSPSLDSLHRLLVPTTLSRMLFAGNEELTHTLIDMPLLNTLQENVPSLVMLDLLIGNKVEGHIAKKIVNMAVERSEAAIECLSPKINDNHLSGRRSFQERRSTVGQEKPPQGPLSLLHILSEVSGYFLLSVPFTTPITVPNQSIVSPHALFTQFLFPFRVDLVQYWRQFSDSYANQRGEIEGVIERHSSRVDALELLFQVSIDSSFKKGIDTMFNELSSVIKLLPSDETLSDASVEYLHYLSGYLSKFTQLLRNSLGLSTPEVSPSQMLAILHESPTELIGRLVFERNISPHKLEKFMSDLPHLKIVEVIVKSCCPTIPNAFPVIVAESFLTETVYSLNTSQKEGNTSTDEEDDPCQLSHKLVNKMIATLKGLCQSDGGQIGVHDLLAASNRTEMKKVLSCTVKLASISLSSLQNEPNRQIAFFSNVTNLLYGHALIFFVQNASLYQSALGISLNVLQTDKLAQIAYFSRVGYVIGELGLVSLYDLHYSLLRHNLSVPVLDKEHKVKFRPSMTMFDPWSTCAPSHPDPRILYVISNGTHSSPVPRLLQPEHINSELDTAESKYLRSNVTINVPKCTVIIPKLLSDYRNDFIPRKSQYDSKNPYHYLSKVALVKYIISKLPKEQGDTLSQLLDSCDIGSKRKNVNELTIEEGDEDITLGYNFPPTRRHSSLGESPQTSHRTINTNKKPSRHYAKIKPYSFTEETITFVHQQAPLLASLVSLLCPPENMSDMPSLQQSSENSLLESLAPDSEEPKKAFTATFSAFARRPKIRQVPDVKRSLSISDETQSVYSNPPVFWVKTFNKLLSPFENGSPLRKFFIARLECFKGLLSWEKTAHESPDEEDSDNSINLRKLAMLPNNSPEIIQACSFVIRKLLRRGMITESVNFLKNEPLVCNNTGIQAITDLVCCAGLVYEANEESFNIQPLSIDPLVLIYTHSNKELATRLILSSLELWPVSSCVNILLYINCHLHSSSPLSLSVNQKLQQLYVYQKIIEAVEIHDGHSPWKHWSDLSYDSREKKDEVLKTLLRLRNFNLARDWNEVHNHGNDIVMQIEEEYIYDLLELEEPDPYTAQSKLEDLPFLDMKKQVCENLLERCFNLESLMLILQFLLGHLFSQISSPEKIRVLTNQLLGVKALLCLPYFIRNQYRQLMRKPLLIIEQLLIDLKIESAGKIIKTLSEDDNIMNLDTDDSPVLKHEPTVLSKQSSNDNPFLILLMFYAEKALEFPVLTLTHSGSRATSPTVPSTPFTRPYERVRSPSESPSISATPRHKRTRGGSFSNAPPSTSDKGKYIKFEPPPHPPKKEDWKLKKYCEVCHTSYFGMFSKRHHCRRCGRVVCSQCSNHFISVEGYTGQQRVCRDCFDHHLLISASSDEQSLSDQEDDRGAAPCLSSQNPWRLLFGDPHYNENLRTEFYYDETPNTTLCLAIIDLMSDANVSAGFILHCCHNVSMQLVPDNDGRVNEEIDHYFTISIMETLLLNAKLKLVHAGDSHGLELCDTYLSRVDLLRLLVSSRYSEIPSIQELTRPELARRVRDRLIADDRYELAMEVSTKCQLDTNTVWTAWGMGCIKAGEFAIAREKFHHSLHGGIQSSGGSFLLERIVEQILSSPLVSVKHSDDWSETVKNTLSLLERRQENAIVDSRRFEECCYYLRTYGTAGNMAGFLGKHSCWFEACQHIRDKHCSTDAFVEHLWLPALKSGQLEALENILQSFDPTLNMWEQYLTAVCRFLSQRKLFHVLYHTQLFMKDYIRAAMTCIKFYTGFSGHNTTLQDLYDRKKFLHTAQDHFQLAIEIRQPKGKKFTLKPDETPRGTKSITITDLQAHINTICLQMRVVDLLHKAAVTENTVTKPVPMISAGGDGVPQPATLFSNGIVRGEVTCHMLTSCQDLNEGFQTAYEIISAYRLPCNKVFTEVSKQLALKERYTDVRMLLQCIQKSSLMSPELNDEVCMAAIKVLASSQTKEARTLDKCLDKLVLMLISDKNKVTSLIQCGKLKNAYLVAIKAKLPEEVEKILDAAVRAGHTGVRDICEKWLRSRSSL